ncbi:hypothetical protein JJV70_15260 [Streptomyces sp. JJ66]|uniref:hypothetical protein n=1 Tax=Streptomyces sp. JJ66 TaxID=2803843 RepID=UPI001C56DC64|nr:hypothetical protein [Streptomyces sp. JJ66]MBW1603438.1 hypothetical protein [Streptomyces sp. JJ66]
MARGRHRADLRHPQPAAKTAGDDDREQLLAQLDAAGIELSGVRLDLEHERERAAALAQELAAARQELWRLRGRDTATGGEVPPAGVVRVITLREAHHPRAGGDAA